MQADDRNTYMDAAAVKGRGDRDVPDRRFSTCPPAELRLLLRSSSSRSAGPDKSLIRADLPAPNPVAPRFRSCVPLAAVFNLGADATECMLPPDARPQLPESGHTPDPMLVGVPVRPNRRSTSPGVDTSTSPYSLSVGLVLFWARSSADDGHVPLPVGRTKVSAPRPAPRHTTPHWHTGAQRTRRLAAPEKARRAHA